MSLNRYAKKRDKSESDIVKALRAAGASVYLTDLPSDALCGYRGVNHILEFKTGNRPLNDNQQKFQEEWRGAPMTILRSGEQALEWINSLKSME